jgi:hypothetical protein
MTEAEVNKLICKIKFAIREELKCDIRWGIHHLLTNPPGSDFNVIFFAQQCLDLLPGKGSKERVKRHFKLPITRRVVHHRVPRNPAG